MKTVTIHKRFRSASRFLEWASSAPYQWNTPTSIEKGNAAWRGTDSYEEAYELAKFGWSDGLKKLSKQVKVAKKLIAPVTQRTRKYDIAGHFPNPARAAAGEPFSMINSGREFKQKPIVKISVNFGCNANVESERIMKWGAAICSYIDALEENGFSVELSSNSQTMGRNNHSLLFEFSLKNAGSRMSMSSMVFWLAHPAALRRIEFAAMEKLDIEAYYGGTYGTAVDNLRHVPSELELFIDDSSGNLAHDLETIKRKHLQLMSGKPTQGNVGAVVKGFKFG